MQDGKADIDAFIGPSHVSVITGSKIYTPISQKYHTPIVVAGFEPVDIMKSVDMILDMLLEKRYDDTDIEYTRSVDYDGNAKAQQMIDKYLVIRDKFVFRGLGAIDGAALRLRDEYSHIDAESKYKDILHIEPIDDHKECICGTILKGLASPKECKLFAKVCTPTNPIGSCMVSDEGACNAYYRYNKEEI
jgi:hydrogenase expression/formation protein HypD